MARRDMKQQLNRIFVAAMLILWTAGAVDTGVATFMSSKALEEVSVPASDNGSYDYRTSGGVVLNFQNATELRRFMRQERVGTWFPWTVEIPFELVPLALAAAFALLGSMLAILRGFTLGQLDLQHVAYVSRPLFGVGIGVMLFFLSIMLPTLLTTGWSAARTETIAGLSLFGGMFSEESYSFIEKKAIALFARKATPHGGKRNSGGVS